MLVEAHSMAAQGVAGRIEMMPEKKLAMAQRVSTQWDRGKYTAVLVGCVRQRCYAEEAER